MYSDCFVCYVLCIVSLFCSVYCLCVNMYCTVATGCQPIAVKKYIIPYHIISYHIISYNIISYRIISYHISPVSHNTDCVAPSTLGGRKEQLHCITQQPERYCLTFWSADLGLMLLSLTNGQPIQIKVITELNKRIGQK